MSTGTSTVGGSANVVQPQPVISGNIGQSGTSRRAFLAYGHRVPREGTLLVDLSRCPRRRLTLEQRAALLAEMRTNAARMSRLRRESVQPVTSPRTTADRVRAHRIRSGIQAAYAEAERHGGIARRVGLSTAACPYEYRTPWRAAWLRGWERTAP